MATAQKKDYSMDDYELRYNDISALYVFAEDLLATVNNKATINKQAQIDLVEPLINELADATDILTEEFLLAAESKKSRGTNKASKKHIEGAIRKISSAIADYHARSKKLARGVANIADAVVEKIQKQVDKVVGIFLEFVNISLQSIMNKTELDALKARDTRIAIMMHQISLAQHS